jgi:hypothetical protein
MSDRQSSRNSAADALLDNKDLYCLLLDIQNGITAPGHASMANGVLLKIDAARKARRCAGSETGWISVKDRLPESSLPPVLAIHMDGPYPTAWIAFYFKNRDRWEHAYKEHPKHLTAVTHWQPLPEAPK